eukprot:jgi/Ulvmu1/7519/UM037_0063.1
MSAKRVLVVNTGSSSLKFKLYDLLPTLHSTISGLMERIGDPSNSTVTIKGLPDGVEQVQMPLKSFADGLHYAFTVLTDRVSPTIADEVAACGHRIVHGGNLRNSCLLDAAAKAEVQRAAMFAPLHNPAQLHGIAECSKVFPTCPQIGVFDTAFHQTMPQAAHTYAIPYSYYKDHGVRRYGAHGTSYRYLTTQASRVLGIPIEHLNLVVAHLGAGSSMCCIKGGKSVDTSMGMTPLEGLVMATRSGDIDPGMLPFLARQGMNIGDIDTLLNKQSGLLGLSGSADQRELLAKAAQGDKRSQLAFDVFVHRIRKYLGAFMLQHAGHTHAIVFSAGIGENSDETRAAVCKDLEFWGVVLDDNANRAAKGTEAVISAPGSGIKVLVIPTDEEELIALDTAKLSGLMT